MGKKTQIHLRNRLVRLLKSTGPSNTVTIYDNLTTQLTLNGTRYLRHPTMNRLCNVLKKHKEFYKTGEQETTHGTLTNRYNVDVWGLRGVHDE